MENILETYSLEQLNSMAESLGLNKKRSRIVLIRNIQDAFLDYKKYQSDKNSKYLIGKQLGNNGKEGTTYLVTKKNGNEYAMKTFRPTKSGARIAKEYELQKLAASVGVAPRVKEYDLVSKNIVMEKMDTHLLDLMKKQKGNLLKWQQLRILDIFRKLDKVGVFHGDANPLNYMLKGAKDLYIIDFGFSRPIDSRLKKKLGTSKPNMKLMLLGFILKLKEMGCPASASKYLIPHLDQETIARYGI